MLAKRDRIGPISRALSGVAEEHRTLAVRVVHQEQREAGVPGEVTGRGHLPVPAVVGEAQSVAVQHAQEVARPAVGCADSVFGDRNLVCSCAGMEAYSA